MKSSTKAISKRPVEDELRPEYDFDLSQARRNPYANLFRRDVIMVPLDPDVSAVFKDKESVNTALRAIIAAYPSKSRRTKR